MKNIVNIINFVRGVEPRPGRDIDLEEPIIKQISLMREHGLKGTFLLQYDALMMPNYQRLMAECSDFCEIGLWLEVVQPLVEAIGEEWKGRYPWDWYNDVGFLIGYEPNIRLRLVDRAMEDFKNIFGKYPASVGSWHIDEVSMKHLSEQYHVDACCICRDQVGTDGYTMQGGYYNQAYYPSVNNMFCPAATKENKIDMPVFRMLGSDPVYAYDYQAMPYGIKYCPTLEPGQLGRNPDWCDWFFREMLSGKGLCFQYMQAGQENSFGWKKMGAGLEYQFPRLAEFAKEGKLEILTLGESGRWFKKSFDRTPAATVVAESAWENPNKKSVWYCSHRYRANLLWDDGIARLRDLYLFDESYPSHYRDRRCEIHACEFRNLPVMDGAIYSNSEKDIVAGIYPMQKSLPIRWKALKYEEINADTACVTLTGDAGELTLTFSPETLTLQTNICDLTLVPVYDRDAVLGSASETQDSLFANHNNQKCDLSHIEKAEITGNYIAFSMNGFAYGFNVSHGSVRQDYSVIPTSGSIVISFDNP